MKTVWWLLGVYVICAIQRASEKYSKRIIGNFVEIYRKSAAIVVWERERTVLLPAGIDDNRKILIQFRMQTRNASSDPMNQPQEKDGFEDAYTLICRLICTIFWHGLRHISCVHSVHLSKCIACWFHGIVLSFHFITCGLRSRNRIRVVSPLIAFFSSLGWFFFCFQIAFYCHSNDIFLWQ